MARWTSASRAGTGRDGFTGVDNLFAFAAAAGVKIIYTLRLLNPVTAPVPDLKSADAGAAGHIWGRYREHLASFAIGNEPDWHARMSRQGWFSINIPFLKSFPG